MRWDRLFDDLEGQAADLGLDERDALVDELRDGEWSETSWRDLLGGRVSIEVLGVGRLDGVVVLANDTILQLGADGAEHVVSVAAVTVLHTAQRRADEATAVTSRLGWGHVFRALRDAGDEISVRLVDGSVRDGTVEVVGRDFVRLRAASGRDQVVVWGAIAVVSGRS